MSQQEELNKLFDYVVAHELDPDDELTKFLLIEQKRKCLVVWQEKAKEIIDRAVVYAAKQKGVAVAI